MDEVLNGINLDEMTSLNLSRNRLVSVPESIGKMGRLKNLNLSHNQLETFPTMLGEEQLLSILDLSFNMIEGDVKFDFQNIRMLDVLNLSNNRITALNATLGKIEYLQTLDLSTNQLTTLHPLSPTIQSFNGSSNPWRLDHPQYASQIRVRGLILLCTEKYARRYISLRERKDYLSRG